jgi:hypothetical protein
MPLNTRIIRDGEPLKLPNGWGGFHIAAMVVAAALDSGQGPWKENTMTGIYGDDAKPGDLIGISHKDTFSLVSYGVLASTPLNEGSYTLKNGPYNFLDKTDGEEFTLLEGDELHAYRG